RPTPSESATIVREAEPGMKAADVAAKLRRLRSAASELSQVRIDHLDNMEESTMASVNISRRAK
ncbi:MAG TPA: hypothetical protein VGW37_04705, partial [Terriglobia bacterium]|nr:hypothetical protein [Terriglobia bacterium]